MSGPGRKDDPPATLDELRMFLSEASAAHKSGDAAAFGKWADMATECAAKLGSPLKLGSQEVSQILEPFRLAPFRLIIPLMAMEATEDGRRLIYESLLDIPRLAPEIRYAVNKVLGRSTVQQTQKLLQVKAVLATYMIAERKALLRRKGWPRGSGSIDLAAQKQAAGVLRMNHSALLKLCRDHGPKGEERRKLQARAQRIAARLPI